jgi:hypothetical protein
LLLLQLKNNSSKEQKAKKSHLFSWTPVYLKDSFSGASCFLPRFAWFSGGNSCFAVQIYMIEGNGPRLVLVIYSSYSFSKEIYINLSLALLPVVNRQCFPFFIVMGFLQYTKFVDIR